MSLGTNIPKPAKPFRPMLAVAADLDNIKYPVIGQEKLDGIRCVIHEGIPKTRMLEDIPNLFIREKLSSPEFHHLDGEILTFTNGKTDDFNTIQSKVMRRDGEPDFLFVAFDHIELPNAPYVERLKRAKAQIKNPYKYAAAIDPTLLHNRQELDEAERGFVSEGYEGIIIRDPNGRYKFGRSTVKEQGLLKYKRFFDAEAKIVGFVEKLRNESAAEKSNVGSTKRSSARAGKAPAGRLGALVVQSREGIQFEIGTGFTGAQRKSIWDAQQSYLGMTVTYRYQELAPNQKPRFPSFIGFRFDLRVIS